MYNILAKRVKGQEYIIYDLVVTRLSRRKFEKLQELNPQLLGGYCYISHKDTDASWWSRARKYLTATHLYGDCFFDCDAFGNVYRVQ